MPVPDSSQCITKFEMRINFTKMHGLGNDFVLLDARRTPLHLTPDRLALLADRRYGVGCDQILMLEAPTLAQASARYRVFNADGSSAEHCGNGVRCVAKYLSDQGDVVDHSIAIEIDGRCYDLTLTPAHEVRVEMGIPRFAPCDVPLQVDAEAGDYALEFQGESWRFGAVSIGNPHAVFEVPDVDAAPVAALGAFLQQHPLFLARVNVGFMQVIDAARIRLRVFERGVGETPACGTGACAAVAIGRCWGKLSRHTAVELRGGVLQIEWAGAGETLFMTGPAATVFEGTINL